MATQFYTTKDDKYISSYPAGHTKIVNLKNQESVFITAIVKSVKQVKLDPREHKEGEKERDPTTVIELEDETGLAQLLIRHPSKLDSPDDLKAQENTEQFFKNHVESVVHILNTRVKVQKKNSQPKILLDKWSQIRVVFDQKIIDALKNPEKGDKKSEQKKAVKVRKEREIEFTNLWDITPNFTRSISVRAKVVNITEFKKLKGFLPDNSVVNDDQGNPVAPTADSILVTLADTTGKIYGVFPKLPKFSSISKGALLSFTRGKIDRFDGDVKGDLQIYLTTFLKDDKRPKYKGEIQVLTPEQAPELEAIPLENEFKEKDAKNVSNKVWVIETPRE